MRIAPKNGAELLLLRGGLDDRVGDLEDVDVHRDALHLSRVQVGLQLQLDHGRGREVDRLRPQVPFLPRNSPTAQ